MKRDINKTIRIITIDRSQAIISGVCFAIAHYFKVDVTIIRLLFFVLFFINLSSLFLYIFLVAILPKVSVEHSEENPLDDLQTKNVDPIDIMKIITFILISFGIYLLLYLMHFPLFVKIWNIPILFVLAISFIAYGFFGFYYLNYVQKRKKKLYLSEEKSIVSGVIGGISETLNIDANVIRAAVILFSFIFIKSLVITAFIYLLLAIYLPKDESITL